MFQLWAINFTAPIHPSVLICISSKKLYITSREKFLAFPRK